MSGSIRKSQFSYFNNNLVVNLVTYVNISYLWNWRSLLGVFGWLNINSGFFATYMLMGPLFFLCLYFHIAKGCITGAIEKGKLGGREL